MILNCNDVIKPYLTSPLVDNLKLGLVKKNISQFKVLQQEFEEGSRGEEKGDLKKVFGISQINNN